MNQQSIRYRSLEFYLKDFLPLYDRFGMNKTQIKEIFKNWKEKKNLESDASDYIWSIFKLLLDRVSESYQQGFITELDFYKKNADIYDGMMEMCHSEQRDHGDARINQIINTINAARLQYGSDLVGYQIKIYKAPNECQTCDELNDKMLTVEEALEHVSQCVCLNLKWYTGCTMHYLPVFID